MNLNIRTNKINQQLRYYFIIIAFLGYFSHTSNAQTATKPKINKICIDAGHGGKDPGCHGQYSYEKDITLLVALKVETLLKDSIKGIQVLQTRYDDSYPALTDRGYIANNAKADLFISIHVNSSPRRNGTKRGTETFVLGLGREDEKENAITTKKGEVDAEAGELMNANDPMTQIMIAQYQQAFLSKSISLGAKIEDEFQNQGRESSGVKQKSLNVLANSGMPGVLVEIGFLNNIEDETYLNSVEGQNEVALAIVKGIKNFKKEYETLP
jgi:N-acetylmuramoyl-L-alanine amidase